MGVTPSGPTIVLVRPSGSAPIVLACSSGVAGCGQGIMTRGTAAGKMATCVDI